MIKNENQILVIGFISSLIILIALVVLLIISVLSAILFKSIIAGFLISAINFAIGLILINYSIGKSERIFLIALWGGLLLRLILGLTIVLISLIFLEINAYGFIFSILFFYVFYLIIEIFYLNLRRKSHFGIKQ
jgi:hypothetical protein